MYFQSYGHQEVKYFVFQLSIKDRERKGKGRNIEKGEIKRE